MAKGGRWAWTVGEQGMRDAKSRPPESQATGEPCAVKVASTVRGGADGKGLAIGSRAEISRAPRQPPTPPHARDRRIAVAERTRHPRVDFPERTHEGGGGGGRITR